MMMQCLDIDIDMLNWHHSFIRNLVCIESHKLRPETLTTKLRSSVEKNGLIRFFLSEFDRGYFDFKIFAAMLLRVFGTFLLLVSSSSASMSKKKFQLPPSSSSSSEEAGEAAPLDHPLMFNLSSPPLSNDQLKFKPHTEWEISYKEGVMYRGFKSDQGMVNKGI